MKNNILGQKISAVVISIGFALYNFHYMYSGILLVLVGILSLYYFYKKYQKEKQPEATNKSPRQENMGIKEFLVLFFVLGVAYYFIRDEKIMLIVAILLGFFYRYVYMPYFKN